MTILDSYAVLAFLKGEPAADDVERLIRSDKVMLTAVGVAETLDHLVRIVGIPAEQAALDLAQLGLDTPATVDGRVGRVAGMLRADHYHRTRRPVSMADCVAVASAALSGQSLATSDPDLLDLASDVGVAVVALPDTSGTTWQTE